ncbi:HEAT repeat domain-containing protein [Marinicella meishanensis]|uniref:HEAT repeat domain-containing protein n=1 Tax=Marinicella meishanensis TaxID=2873263 RepID=UPI001CBE3FF0|nr:hypothetical protein [Marinicella sp. NBU2979]
MLKKMKHTLALTAVFCSSACWAQFPQLDINRVDASLSAHSQKHDGWLAYSVPAAVDTPSMCCWNQGEQTVCDLNEKQYGYGSSSHSPNTDFIHVFVHMDDGAIKRMLPVGDHCEVKADGLTIDWLTAVDSQDSIDWLTDTVTNQQEGDENGALYVLSLHAGEAAARALYDLAANNQDGYSEQSVFWLGQREQDGFAHLQELYETLPVGEVRRKINFALSQNRTTEAVELLQAIAQDESDGEQQADAIFWLSQTDQVADLPAFLVDLMSHTERREVKEKAIFSLSQINSDEANDELAKLVKDHLDAEVREKALFWLAQNSPQRAEKAALALLNTRQDRGELDNAVFVLSQLPSEQSAKALLQVVKGHYARSVKKQALFWLTQTEDEATLKQLEDLL